MPSQWSPEQRQQALQALVLASGNSKKAAQHLEATGLPVPPRTLRDWRNEFADQYEQLEKTRDDWTAQFMADSSEALSALFAEVEARYALSLLNRSDEDLKDISASTLATAMNKATVSRSLSIQRANELRQRPTKPIGEVMSFEEALKALDRFGKQHPDLFGGQRPAIESTAEEIKDES